MHPNDALTKTNDDDLHSGGEERDSFVESIESNEFIDSQSNSEDEDAR